MKREMAGLTAAGTAHGTSSFPTPSAGGCVSKHSPKRAMKSLAHKPGGTLLTQPSGFPSASLWHPWQRGSGLPMEMGNPLHGHFSPVYSLAAPIPPCQGIHLLEHPHPRAPSGTRSLHLQAPAALQSFSAALGALLGSPAPCCLGVGRQGLTHGTHRGTTPSALTPFGTLRQFEHKSNPLPTLSLLPAASAKVSLAKPLDFCS